VNWHKSVWRPKSICALTCLRGWCGAHSSGVGWGTMLQAARSGRGFETSSDQWFFLVYLILRAALFPGVYWTSNRNMHQKQKQLFLWSRAQPARKGNGFTAIALPFTFYFFYLDAVGAKTKNDSAGESEQRHTPVLCCATGCPLNEVSSF
jgi:hypothetical protein